MSLSNANVPNPTATPTTTTTYILTASNSGCEIQDSVTITVNSLPIITKSNDITKCSNDTVKLMAAGGVRYEWRPTQGLTATNIPEPFTTIDTSIVYYIKVTSTNTCEALDSVVVKVTPKPVFSITPASLSLCSGDSASLTATGGDAYKWITGTSNNATPTLKVSPLNTTLYKVVITENNCNTSDTLTSQIYVKPLPQIHIFKSNDINCILGRATLSASGGSKYRWSPETSLSNIFIGSPVATPTQTTNYHVKAFSDFGCISEDSILVKVDYSSNKNGYVVSNAFTPNDDGINDCFSVKNWGAVSVFEMSVYNRWGEKIFFTDNPLMCWNGIYKGEKQQAGTYVYQIKAVTICGSVYRKGTVMLIR